MPAPPPGFGRLLLAAALGLALLDPFERPDPPRARRPPAPSVATVASATVGALLLFPHGNRTVQAQLLALARALPLAPAFAKADPAGAHAAAAAYFAALGLASCDPLLDGVRHLVGFAFGDELTPTRALDGLAVLPRRGARCRSPLDEIADAKKLRAKLRAATGS